MTNCVNTSQLHNQNSVDITMNVKYSQNIYRILNDIGIVLSRFSFAGKNSGRINENDVFCFQILITSVFAFRSDQSRLKRTEM